MAVNMHLKYRCNGISQWLQKLFCVGIIKHTFPDCSLSKQACTHVTKYRIKIHVLDYLKQTKKMAVNFCIVGILFSFLRLGDQLSSVNWPSAHILYTVYEFRTFIPYIFFLMH